ncbi:MAG: hypothetical protein PHQ42_02970 [Patescibacteria group bacterium]|nr:hypothetical protein [Patescibacteria group bacterium]
MDFENIKTTQPEEEKTQNISEKDIGEAEKEIYMTGRAMLIGETPEEYGREREESWEEMKRVQAKKDRGELEKVRQEIAESSDREQGEASDTKTGTSEQKNPEGLEKKDYGEFRVKNGETDVGVFWYEYGNTAAKKLKESGKLEWGKERIYFDIPLNNMEELRNLAFAIAESEKIPIAFKHLDTQKTHQIDLRQDSETTRFVTNFASIEDAKRFYQALQKREEYRRMKSDRNQDYHGFNIDGVAHYASGYREKRLTLKSIIDSAKLNPDGTYTYTGIAQDSDGKWRPTGEKKIPKELLEKFKRDYAALPDPEKTWKNTNI